MHVNLLPGAFRRQLLVRRCLNSWIIVWGACAALSLSAVAVKYQTLVSERKVMAEMEARAAPIRQVMTDSVALKRQLDDQRQRVDRLHALSPNDKSLSLLSVLSTRAHVLSGRLQVRRFALQHSTAPQPSTAVTAGAPTDHKTVAAGQMILEAVAEDDGIVASFLHSLRAAKVFRDVELKSCTQWGKVDDNQRKFDVICTF
jgi:hypothetical protein